MNTEGLIAEQLDDLDTNDWTLFLKYVQQEGFDLEGESAKDAIRRLITVNSLLLVRYIKCLIRVW